ncbi:MAG: M15 family metallopeptidase [Candidatus Liptonbacteria bacterium]
MINNTTPVLNPKRVILVSAGTALALFGCAAGGYLWYAYQDLRYDRAALRESVVILEKTLERMRENLALARGENEVLTGQNADLAGSLRAEQTKTNELQYSLQNQINQIYGTVGTLEKLSKTDSELLVKYSKIYFLNENYVPPSLSAIDSQYLNDPQKSQQVLANVSPFLNQMLQNAAQDRIDLKVISAYRSFAEQAAVKTGYKVTYGSGANKFSADQGYSEHQLGTTVDLTTPGATPLSTKFENTPAYKWLGENVHRYGFILSYPKNNAYYIFEPWHWRFVGVALATTLHNGGKYFYEMSQREIDAYLVRFFDTQ